MSTKAFPKALTDKYIVSPALQPAVTEFPKKFDSFRIDLSNENCVQTVDLFVSRFKDTQTYFQLKPKASSSGSDK